MKKLLLILFMMILICGLLWFFLFKDKSTPELFELFNQKPDDGETIVITPSGTENVIGDNQPYENEKEILSLPQQSENTNQNTNQTENSEVVDNSEASQEKTEEQTASVPPENDQPEEKFTHSDNEKQKIIGRYIEAEDFYYTILYQRYDLDGYDVIKRKNADGYETEYHRVLYYNVNSIADLKKHYLEYFTSDFVAGIDFSAYVEANGKLYCAVTGNSSGNPGAKYTYTAESVDITNAYVVRTDSHGNGSTKIKAVNNGGNWYFSSVAIR